MAWQLVKMYIYVLESSTNVNDVWKLSQTTQGYWAWEKVVVKFRTKKPSPRLQYNGWEYLGNMWIFGGFGPDIVSYPNDHGQYVGYEFGYNNQLLQFNPDNKE